jgi:phosphoglycolate phosphatase-like HAD superfamily hydrolase
MKLRIAFDLDETLGVPVIENDRIVGFRARDGAAELLAELSQKRALILWTVSLRSYLDKVLGYGLGRYFTETYTNDEIAVTWKDIRRIRADYLIDDSPHHAEEAANVAFKEVT